MSDRSIDDLPKPVERLRSMIQKGYADPDFKLDKCIHAMPFHYDYMRKLFRKEMGVSPLGFMTELRMQRAGELLRNWNPADRLCIGCVAEQCGFSDALYFSRVFKKHYGQSPTDYYMEFH